MPSIHHFRIYHLLLVDDVSPLMRGWKCLQQGLAQEYSERVPSFTKQALKAAGVEFIVAPYEADAQMAYLALNSLVHAVRMPRECCCSHQPPIHVIIAMATLLAAAIMRRARSQ